MHPKSTLSQAPGEHCTPAPPVLLPPTSSFMVAYSAHLFPLQAIYAVAFCPYPLMVMAVAFPCCSHAADAHVLLSALHQLVCEMGTHHKL
jgi:hypothetical protein